MQKKTSYPPQEQKEEIPSVLWRYFVSIKWNFVQVHEYTRINTNRHLRLKLTNHSITVPPVLLHFDEEDGTEGKKDKDE